MTPTCAHGMPSPASCWECMEDGVLAAPPPSQPRFVAESLPVPARFDGHCVGCNLAIHVGQPIVLMGTGSWWHEWCGLPA